ncbi:MAG: hypothetical protein LBU16_00250 [Treponema sp.]|nr:hypothetical protein [Treponema sp.]
MKKRIVTRRTIRTIALGGALLALAAATTAALVVRQNRPRPTWYVEESLEQQWRDLLERTPAPPPFTRQSIYDPAVGLRKGRYGVIIATILPARDALFSATDGNTSPSEDPPPIRLFPGLYRDRADYQGVIPLALDPWLVFHKTTDPPLALERVLNSAGGPGVLILPGAEPEATRAWTAQLLQASPGSFPPEKQAWDETEQRLVHGNSRFQQGALTYTWFDAWIKLLQSETAWVYAPLSRTRGLASYDAGRLDAAVFPIPADWNTYGLQAEILWAVPQAPEDQADQAALLDEAKAWLRAAETQRIIAEMLGWIPAQSGIPYDTLARKAQTAWFSSGYIWQ